jgi:hypothetical protein
MKRSSVPGLKVAMEFESIIAQGDGKRDAVSPKLYAIEGVSGVFKRVPRSGRGIDAPKDAVLCSFEGSIIELVMAEEVMEELAEALFPLKGDDTAHAAHLLDRRDRSDMHGGPLGGAMQNSIPIKHWSFRPGEKIGEAKLEATVEATTRTPAVSCVSDPDGWKITSPMGEVIVPINDPLARKLMGWLPLTDEDVERLKSISKKPEESQPCDQKTEPASTPGTPTEPSATSQPPGRTPPRRSTSSS